MNDRNGGAPPSDPANNEVSVDSGWPSPLAGESDSDGADNYFIQDFGEATIIGSSERASAGSLAGTSSDCGGGRGPSVLNHHPSVSSSSSEDQKPPPEIPSTTKGRKKGEKRIRQVRFAFVTKSEVDQLEDGFRWRKYGQKAVKNSPFPRSYYRCTNSKCTVKKRVERSSEDPTTVITTYEGQHCHHAVGFHRAAAGFISHESLLAAGQTFSSSPNFYYAGGVQLRPSIQQYSQLQQATNSSDVGGSQMLLQLPHQMQQQSDDPTDEGLLGDMVPPGMRNI